jgi:hypothetical protein
MSRVYSNYKNQHDLPFLFKIIFDVFGELAKHTSTISAATYSNKVLISKIEVEVVLSGAVDVGRDIQCKYKVSLI